MIFDGYNERTRRYLSNTVCLVNDGEKEEVGYVYNDEGLFFRNVSGDNKRIDIRGIKRYEFLTPSLGYIPIDNDHDDIYVYRIPRRHWRVGLTNGNLSVKLFSMFELPKVLELVERAHLKDYKVFSSDMLKNRRRTAISKNYAVSSKGLFYRNKKVATVIRDTALFNNESSMIYHRDNINSLTYGSLSYKVINREQGEDV